MTEEWRPVAGFEGYYEVSSFGRIKSLDRIINSKKGRGRFQPARLLNGSRNAHGYWVVSLCRDGSRRDALLHRLVCEAFHGPAPSREHDAAHNDGDPGNAFAGNLRWATHIENAADKRAHGTHTCGARHSQAKLTLADVRQIISSDERNGALAKRFGVSPATITDIQKGRSWREALEMAE